MLLACDRRAVAARPPGIVYTVCYGGGTLCYMKRYGVRELRQNASMLLRQVAAGETIEITNNGQPVAQLIPAVYDPWAALVASKEVTPARTTVSDVLARPPRPYRLLTAPTTEPRGEQ